MIPKNFVLKVGMAWKDEENKSIEEFERQEAEKQRKRQQRKYISIFILCSFLTVFFFFLIEF